MNSARSPAPGVGLFNLPVNKKNNAIVNAVNSAVNSVVNSVVNNVPNSVNSSSNSSAINVTSIFGGNVVNIILGILLIVVIVLFAGFWKEINSFFNMMYESLRQVLGAKPKPVVPRQEDEKTIRRKPKNPQESSPEKSIVEKVLPGRQEVFNISKNSYTYYDAEPLCKALNAELATYEQVKQAYNQGADWCNYGWVKGQMAVYPTQKATFETLQAGPENQRNSCGNVGLNGGYFDNPELKFGVNCYGSKPDQKAHDATAVTSGEGAPLSPGNLIQEKKIAKFRGETNYISVLPWNKNAWSS